MSMWITILLAVLPKLLEWFLSLVRDGKRVDAVCSERATAKINHVLHYCRQLNVNAPSVGLPMNGIKPPAESVEDVEGMELFAMNFADGGPVGGLLDTWIQKFITEQLRTNGKELGLKIVKSVLIPLARERVDKTQNKVDNVALKHFENMLNDPEFISAVEGIG